MKKIITTTPKNFVKYPNLLRKLNKYPCTFVNGFIDDLSQIKELTDTDEKILMLDELNVKDEFHGVNKYLGKMKNVTCICSLSSRYHELDLKKLTELGIKYCNNPDTTSQSVAELAMMHLLMLIRKQPLYKNSDFDFYGMNNLGRELNALSVGILGYGFIGERIATICSSLGMKVKIWSRSKKESPYKQVEIEELLKQDVIFISVISGVESKKLFNEEFYKSIDKNKYVVDMVADDALYDKNRFIKMCNENKLAGFGFEAENQKSKYMKTIANVSISPHVAWGTVESHRRWIEGWVNCVIAAFNGKPINVVN